MTAFKNLSIPCIRPATPADVGAIFDIRTRVKENPLSREQLTEMGITDEAILEAMLAAPCLWIAEVDGAPVGFSMADLEEASVFAMFILPGFEDRGIGRSLMARAEEALFDLHSTIWLETSAESRAFGFYQKLGWQEVERFEDGDVRLEKTKPVAHSHR